MENKNIENLTPDAILSANTAIFTKQMEIIWGLMKHVSFVSAATYVAWYLLLNEGKYILSTSLILLSSIIMLLLLMTIRRQLHLQINYGRKIIRKLGKSPRFPSKFSIIDYFSIKLFDSKATAEILARAIPTFILISYHFLLYVTFWEWKEEALIIASCLLFINSIATLLLLIYFKPVIQQLTKR